MMSLPDHRSPRLTLAFAALILSWVAPSISSAQATDEPLLLTPPADATSVPAEPTSDAAPLDVPTASPTNGQAEAARRPGKVVLGAQLLGLSDIGQVSTNIRPPADPKGQQTLPADKTRGVLPTTETKATTLIYDASGYRGYLAPGYVAHRPTYFEETRLERYGHAHSHHVQPFVSATRFGVNLAALPYKMTVERPRFPRVEVHPFETGGVAPHYFDPYPRSTRAAAVEVATIAGLILIIP